MPPSQGHDRDLNHNRRERNHPDETSSVLPPTHPRREAGEGGVSDLSLAIENAQRGRKQMVKCPAHDDATASLSVAPGLDQPVILHCHATCTADEVLAAAGLDWSAVSRQENPTHVNDEWTPFGPASNVYSYVDEEGRELFQVLRVPQPGGKKRIIQRHMGPDSRWVWRLGDSRRVLYRLPEVRAAVEAGRTIYVVEGEKDVETLRYLGHVATTAPMGAGKWDESYAEALTGADVVIISDADEAGREHARQVRDSLLLVDATVQIRETTLAGCNDVTDHIAKGGSLDSLAITWQEEEVAPTFGIGIQDFVSTDFPDAHEIIPGMLAAANVTVLTGFEGTGKSEFMRQFAVLCAAGLNPLTLAPMRPLKVIYIDSENPEHQAQYSWRNLAGLAARHTGRPVANDALTILSEWRNEPDLLSMAGQSWLYERVQAYRPDLVLMGPVQNLVSRDVRDDEVVRKLKHAVNTARAMCGSAFILEHHAPHRQSGDKERSLRPYGSSLFLKWPDFGYGLRFDSEDQTLLTLEPFRKPRVRHRAWPEYLRTGRPGTLEFPFMEAEPPSTNVFQMGVRGA